MKKNNIKTNECYSEYSKTADTSKTPRQQKPIQKPVYTPPPTKNKQLRERTDIEPLTDIGESNIEDTYVFESKTPRTVGMKATTQPLITKPVYTPPPTKKKK